MHSKLKLLYLITFIIIICGCGSDMNTSSNDTGSASFSLKWENPSNNPTFVLPLNKGRSEEGLSYAPIDCTSLGVSTVSANVYDSGGTYITSGGPWNCADHSGTITGISAGINRMIAIDGNNSSSRKIYYGQITGVIINTGQKTNAGQITMTYVANDTTAPTDGTLSASAGNSQVSLSWSGFSDSGSGIGSYKLVYSTTGTPSSCSVGTQIWTGTGTSYTHTGLTNSTTYYYRVCAIDNAGNTSSGATTSGTPTSTGTTTTSGTYEPNDSFDTAYILTSGNTITEKISSSTDVDYYAINVTSTGTISISMTPPSSKDYDLELFNPSRSSIDISGGGTGVTESISYTATTTGTYYIKVYGFAGAYDATNTYSLTTSSGGTNDILAPSSPSVSINSGASSTTSTSVTLTLSATDNVGVTGYYASETSTTPSASASGWTAITSTTPYSGSVSFTLSSGDGTKTVYIWFKDAAGNVS